LITLNLLPRSESKVMDNDHSISKINLHIHKTSVSSSSSQ